MRKKRHEVKEMIPKGERPIMEVVYSNIEYYRKEANMTAKELCEKAGYNYQSFCKKTTGLPIEMRPYFIQQFAYALDVATICLFEDWSE